MVGPWRLEPQTVIHRNTISVRQVPRSVTNMAQPPTTYDGFILKARLLTAFLSTVLQSSRHQLGGWPTCVARTLTSTGEDVAESAAAFTRVVIHRSALAPPTSATIIYVAARKAGSREIVVGVEKIRIEAHSILEFMRRFLVPLIERECAAARHVRIGEAGGQLQRLLTGALRLDQVVFFCAIPFVKSGMHHRQ